MFRRVITPLLRHLFIREFSSWDEDAVRLQLEASRNCLEEAFRLRDSDRADAVMVEEHDPHYSCRPFTRGYYQTRLMIANERVVLAQNKLDYMRGLAYLMGYGKIVDRVSR